MAVPKKYHETLHFYMSIDLKADLEARAIKDGVTMAAIARRAVEVFLKTPETLFEHPGLTFHLEQYMREVELVK